MRLYLTKGDGTWFTRITEKQFRIPLIVVGVAILSGVCFLGIEYARAGRLVRQHDWERALPISLRAANTNEGEQKTFFTGVLDSTRVRAEYVALNGVPPVLKNAVVAIEDHRFYRHFGIDTWRTGKAVLDSCRSFDGPRGTSTLTQQLARNLYLTRGRSYKRKFQEFFVALQLERRYTKDEILERYLNLVPMGREGSFDLVGVGAASRHYFGKAPSELNLSEAAMLAGMIQSPSRLNPRRNPEQARNRRTLVLRAMLRHKLITPQQLAEAKAVPVQLAPEAETAVPGNHFVDAVRREIATVRPGGAPADRTLLVETTMDSRLQQIAEQVAEKATKNLKGAEVTLVALDPRTGAIRAMVGGKSYQESQFNRAFAKRQPGSTFKPFVYAAAMQRSLQAGAGPYSPETIIDDSPAEFQWKEGLYTPTNFHDEYRGPITLQEALAVSSNVAAVRLASEVGYNRVAEVARQAGLNSTMATPSAALGSYEVTPVELAGAYAMLANGGQAVRPYVIESLMDRSTGSEIFRASVPLRRVLDERVAYLVTSMLEGVMNYGTAARARALGLRIPAAGKTGTTTDSWFAGFSTELVCVAWIGADDNRDIHLEGSKAALPLWVEFMKKASTLKPYSGAKAFRKPMGVDYFLERVRETMPLREELPAPLTTTVALVASGVRE